MAVTGLVNQPNVTDFNPTIIRKLDCSPESYRDYKSTS